MNVLLSPLPTEIATKQANTPTEYAVQMAVEYNLFASSEQRRKYAQFFTPIQVARFMAEMGEPLGERGRILDPAAGTGILAAAVAEQLSSIAQPVHLDAYEVDRTLAAICERTLAYTQQWLARRGVEFTYNVYTEDFILANASALTPSLFSYDNCYQVAILNPPYFKLGSKDPRVVAVRSIVNGQPNIYALFLAITAALLAEGGTIVSITPRSFATGDYFREFRRYFFGLVVPERVHLFVSRREAFKQDVVLQENIILKARRAAPTADALVKVSTSSGVEDLAEREEHSVSLAVIFDQSSPDATLNIPANQDEDKIIAQIKSWPDNLATLGLSVSTGPVVQFRATELITSDLPLDIPAVPLLLLQNVTPMQVTWPLNRNGKPQYVRLIDKAKPILLRNTTYVLLRRFTAKEERRRLTAAPLLAEQIQAERLGFENHLNYIYRRDGELTADEAVGLAVC